MFQEPTILSRKEFVVVMTKRFAIAMRNSEDHDGMDFAIISESCLDQFLKDEDIEYGDKSYNWDVGGAFDLAEQELSYWDDE